MAQCRRLRRRKAINGEQSRLAGQDKAGIGMKRLAAGLVGLLDFLLTGLAVILGLIGWRLITGPIEIDDLTPYLERQLATENMHVNVGHSLVRWDGLGQPIRLVVTDAEIARDGGPSAYFPAVALSLDARALLHGQFEPTTLIFEGPTFNVVRSADGDIRWAFEQAGGRSAPDSPPPPADLDHSATWPSPLQRLTEIRVVNAAIEFEDHQNGRTWHARDVSLSLERGQADLTARLGAEIAKGEDNGRFVAWFEYDGATGETTVAVRLLGLPSRLLSDVHDMLKPLSAVRARLDGIATLQLDAGWRPREATIDVSGEMAELVLAGLYDAPVAVARLSLFAEADFGSDLIRLNFAEIDLGGPRILASGEMRAENDLWHSTLTATLSELPVDLLPRYWPPSLNREARQWTAEHIADGIVDEAVLEIDLRSPVNRPADLRPESVRAHFAYTDLTVRYLDGLPPVLGVAGTGSYDGDVVRFAIEHGEVLDLPLDQAAISIANFHDPGGETIDINIALSGPLTSALQIVDSPRLGYASALGLDTDATAGAMAARLRFEFPLAADLALDEVAIGVAANLRNVGLGEVTAGVQVNGINGALSLTGEGMELTGQGRIGAISGDLVWQERFAAANGPPTLITLAGVLDDTVLADLGLEEVPITGIMPFQATFQDVDRRNQSLAIRLNLSDATIAVDALSYIKPSGTAAEATIDLTLENRRISQLIGFSLAGEALDVRGAATLTEDRDRLQTLRFDQLALGDTRFVGTVTATETGGYAIEVSGETFDARRWLTAEALTAAPLAGGISAGDDENAEPAEPPPWQISASFDEVIVGEGAALYDATLEFAQAADGAESAVFVGKAGDDSEIHLEYSSDGVDAATVSLHTDAADAVLRALGARGRLSGGELFLRASLTDGGVDGRIRVDEFRVVEAPLLARLLAAMSLGGLQDLLSGEGIVFDRLSANLSLTGKTLTIEDGRISGGSLGLALEGQVGLEEAGELDLSGTVVPAYGVNRTIELIPLVGELLTGGDGGGFIAFTYRATGPIDNPQVQVNPLSALAPGMLRRIFFMRDGEEVEIQRRGFILGDDDR